ncbi:hypothetical protein DW981_13770, partial [Clostridium sp. AM49-4BH]
MIDLLSDYCKKIELDITDTQLHSYNSLMITIVFLVEKNKVMNLTTIIEKEDEKNKVMNLTTIIEKEDVV